jgi:hypothetical protein
MDKKNNNNAGLVDWFKSSIFPMLSVLLSAIILYIIFNPVNVFNNFSTVQILNKVGKAANTPAGLPTAIGKVGDGVVLAKADELRKGNPIDAVVYKDAKDGDYVLGYTGKTIIYRESDNTIVYNDKSAQVLLQDQQNAVVANVVAKAQEAGVIAKDNTSVPAVSVVTDPEAVKKINEFYVDVQKDDLVAQFSKPDLVVVFRPGTQKIVKSGTFSLVIK